MVGLGFGQESSNNNKISLKLLRPVMFWIGYVGAFQNNEHGLGQSSNNNKTKLDIL